MNNTFSYITSSKGILSRRKVQGRCVWAEASYVNELTLCRPREHLRPQTLRLKELMPSAFCHYFVR